MHAALAVARQVDERQHLSHAPAHINRRQALAASTLLMLVCAAGFILLERVRYEEVGEF